MEEKELIKKEILKETFIQYVLKQAEFFEEGDSKNANKFHSKINKLYQKAKKKGWVDIFHSLLNHEDENVRLWAAGFSLKTESKLAEATLKRLTRSKDFFVKEPAKFTLELFYKEDWEHLLV